jgi:hypothetical protein
MKNNYIHNVKNTGFSAPKDYFKDLESSLMRQAKLAASTDNNAFKTPEDYFETIENTILKRVSTKDTSKIISLYNKRTIVYISSIAAAILLLFNLSIFKNELTWDSLDVATVENYLINEDMSSYEIASKLEDIDLSEEDFVQYDLNDANIESYLLIHTDIENLIIE